MTADRLEPEPFRDALAAACSRVIDATDELCALDAAAGDGDLGATLATGFRAVKQRLPELKNVYPGPLLVEVGRQLVREAPSTSGTLIGSAHMRAGRALPQDKGLSAGDIALFLREAQKAVSERGGAEPGQRTMVDAMAPAAEAAAQAAHAGEPPAVVFAKAADAASRGASETAAMTPQHGRAGWIGERARGKPDAGATAWAIYLRAFGDALATRETINAQTERSAR
jgi:phosphoenolpyruvate---glycerone phosphotransferase subunit DhaL